MPETVRAVVVDPSSPQGLGLKPVELAPAAPDEVTVRVTAISLNRGEVRRATSQGQPGDRPGWDFAGIVEERAANGSGPPVGSRVVGMLPSGAWAERVRAPSHAVAPLAGGGHRCAGRDAAGRRADRTARAASGRALARPQGAGRRRLGRGRAPRRPARRRLGSARLGPGPPAGVPRHGRRMVRRAHRARRRSQGRGTARARSISLSTRLAARPWRRH